MSTTIYGIVSAIGLSPEFMNFKRKHHTVTNKVITQWNSETDNDFEFNILHRFTNVEETETHEGLTQPVKETVMAAIDLVLVKSINDSLSIDKGTTKTEFENAFPSAVFEFEDIFQDTNNSVWVTKMSIVSGAETAHIYFYPAKFEVSYPNSNVSVIPLMDDVDSFASVGLSTINSLIGKLDTLPFSAEFAEITQELPCTNLTIDEHQWVNKSNTTETTPVPFGIISYGYPSEESKEQAVRQFIERNSTLSKTDREIIFPGLFGSSGFNLFPFWDQISQEQSRNIYSPILRPNDMIEFVKNNVDALNGIHVNDTWEFLPTLFQSIGILSVPDQESYDEIGQLKQHIETYFLVAPSDGNFSQMGPEVQEFVKSLFEALSCAELHPSATPTQGIDIEIIGGLTYATFFSLGLRWRVLTKVAFENVKG